MSITTELTPELENQIDGQIEKLNSVFKSILNCTFAFESAEKAIRADKWNRSDLCLLIDSLPADRPRYIESVLGESLGFPVYVSDQGQQRFAGLAATSGQGRKSSDPERIILLAELFTFVFEANLKLQMKREDLVQTEARLRLVDAASNVVPMRRGPLAHALHDLESNAMPAKLPPRGPSPLLLQPLLIISKENYPLQRAALELHQTSNRWAFLSTNDLPAEIFHSKNSLLQLGAITLFIPDLTALPVNSQLKLAEYLALEPNDEMPQVIAGSRKSAAELEESRAVLPHLLHMFFVSQMGLIEPEIADEEKSPFESTADLVNASLRVLINEIRGEHQISNHLIPFHIQYFDPDRPTVH